jgi:hypothetical protein
MNHLPGGVGIFVRQPYLRYQQLSHRQESGDASQPSVSVRAVLHVCRFRLLLPSLHQSLCITHICLFSIGLVFLAFSSRVFSRGRKRKIHPLCVAWRLGHSYAIVQDICLRFYVRKAISSNRPYWPINSPNQRQTRNISNQYRKVRRQCRARNRGRGFSNGQTSTVPSNRSVRL